MNTHTVGVIGGGTMGTGIAYVSALGGAAVTVVEPDAGRAAAMQAALQRAAASGVKRGKLEQQGADALLARIRRVASVAELPEGMELAIETVSERFDLKCEVLAAIAARSPGLIATNTSALAKAQDRLRVEAMKFANALFARFPFVGGVGIRVQVMRIEVEGNPTKGIEVGRVRNGHVVGGADGSSG